MFIISGGRFVVNTYEEGLVLGRDRSGRLAKARDACDFGTDGHRAKKKKEDPSTVGRNRKVGEIPSLSFVYIRKMRR